MNRANRIVARYQDGHTEKGVTNDFLPVKDVFHLLPWESNPGAKPLEVRVAELKALFFVKEYAGDPTHQELQEFEPALPVPGRKIRVVFNDGEILIGTTQGYQPGRPGFFVLPADRRSNNERCFVVAAAAREVSFV